MKNFNNFINERKSTPFEIMVFTYLNDLRDSGETNMFGAAPYVQDEFEIDKNEARRLVSLWMNNFNDEGNYDEIKE